MVREPVELGKRGACPSCLWPRSAPVGVKVLQQRRRARSQGCGGHSAMEVAHGIEQAVLEVHEAVNLVCRPVRVVKVVRQLERVALCPHAPYSIEEGTRGKICNGPLVQSTQPLRKTWPSSVPHRRARPCQ
jgi:hypothetical protein